MSVLGSELEVRPSDRLCFARRWGDLRALRVGRRGLAVREMGGLKGQRPERMARGLARTAVEVSPQQPIVGESLSLNQWCPYPVREVKSAPRWAPHRGRMTSSTGTAMSRGSSKHVHRRQGRS